MFVHFWFFFVFSNLVLDFVLADANEEKVCSIDGEYGICKKLKSCPTALRGTMHHSICGSDKNNKYVCCKKVADVLTTTKRFPRSISTTEYTPKEYMYVDLEGRPADGCAPVEGAAKPTGQKAWDKCVEYHDKYVFPCEKSAALGAERGRVNRCHHNADELVIGGTAAKKHEFPHMVLLGYEDTQKKIEWQCGGSLISEKFVLTAGHCIADLRQFNVSHALVGVLKRSEVTAENKYEVKRIVKHDGYQSPNKYNDIALLELDRDVPLSHAIVPACLHSTDTAALDRAAATGWGSTHVTRQANSDVLQKVILTRFKEDECSDIYGYSRHMKEGFQADSQVCYGDKTKSQDTCRGDSGGPLQVKSRSIPCMYIVVGVTSFGMECGKAGAPAIYTRVSHYLPWIESIVWP